MNLVVDKVSKFKVVHVADRYTVFERFARAAVEKLNFAVFGKSVFLQKLFDVVFGRAVEYGGCDLPVKHFRDKSQVNFKNLTDIHTGRNAQRVQHDLQRRTVCHKRHVFFGKNAGHDAFVTVTARHLVADRNLTFLRDIYAHLFVDAGSKLVPVLSCEDFHVDNDTAFAVRHTEGRIAHFSCFIAENCTKKSFFGRKFGFALRGDFTDENVAASDFRADSDDTVFVQVFKSLFRKVGDISRYLFFAESRFAGFAFVFFDVDRGENVVAYELFGNKYRVFVVIAFPAHEADKDISAKREFAVLG